VFAVSNKGQVWRMNSPDSWSMAGNFPENMQNIPLTFSINGKGYCIGNNHCWEFNPATGQWVRKKDPPGPVSIPLVINGKAYFKNDNNQMIEYDPASDTYSIKSNCPATGLAGGFVVNGYGFYTYDNGQCWKYDPVTDSWQQKASFNIQGTLYNTSSFSLNDFGYIIGDLNFQAYSHNLPMAVIRYSVSRDEWVHCNTDSYQGNGAYNISTISFNGIVYVGLGYNTGDFNATDFWKFQ
jgi:hypothetical protein